MARNKKIVDKNAIEGITKKSLKNKKMGDKNAIEGITGIQLVLDIGLEAYKEYDGFEVGVLSDGTHFFTKRGLGEFVGVANSHIGELSSEKQKKVFTMIVLNKIIAASE